jgi:hypothetical protein
MFTGLLTSVTHRLQSCLATSTRWFLILREHYKAAEGLREARGTKLLRVWLSPDQRAQFDASKTFEVVGANSGKRYRIVTARAITSTNSMMPGAASWVGVLSPQVTSSLAM